MKGPLNNPNFFIGSLFYPIVCIYYYYFSYSNFLLMLNLFYVISFFYSNPNITLLIDWQIVSLFLQFWFSDYSECPHYAMMLSSQENVLVNMVVLFACIGRRCLPLAHSWGEKEVLNRAFSFIHIS